MKYSANKDGVIMHGDEAWTDDPEVIAERLNALQARVDALLEVVKIGADRDLEMQAKGAADFARTMEVGK